MNYLITKTGFVHYYPEDMDKFVVVRRLLDTGEAVKVDAYELRSILCLCEVEEDAIKQVFDDCGSQKHLHYLRRFPLIDEVMLSSYGYRFHPLDYRNIAEMHEKTLAIYSELANKETNVV